MITRMDASIGSLIERLDDPNGDNDNSDSELNNTLIIFSSDNGPTVEDNSPIDFFNANGQFRGGKFEAYEGGIHMPSFAYWPGTIEPGTSTAYRTDMADFMATAADLAGVETPVGIDGTSIAPILTGQGRMRERDYIIVEQQGGHGADPDPRVTRWTIIRQDGMKLIRYDDESSELFDLNADPGETSPLSLGVPANADLASELQSLAIAEGVTRGTVEYRTWSGPNGGDVHDGSSWNGAGPPTEYWSAVLANNSAEPRIAHVNADVTTLGFEVRGQSAQQVVEVHAGRTLTGRNEVRISANGRVDLSGGTIASNRWVNVRAAGEIRGDGAIEGDVYNEGTLSPGQRDDSPTWPIVTPPALPAANLDTGVVNAVTFDFTGVQDDVPLFAASTQSPYVEVTRGLDWGPGTGPRWSSGGSNAGNELNHIGHATTSLADAITADNYISFTVDPKNGAGMIPDSISFRLWRNGGAAAQNFAILSSATGFTTSSALVQATYTDTGSGNQHLLTAPIPATEATSGPIEYRLYGWGASVNTGNTHVNLVSLNARFVGAPTIEFDFAGVQDAAPLTALKRSDDNLLVTAGLSFGPGVSPRGANNAGNEFHAAGFSTSSTLQSSLSANDYLAFAVQPVEGLAMYADSVSFTLWRDGADSATDYAVYSSVDGFNDGAQLSHVVHSSIGTNNRLTITGNINDSQPTTESVEFRLYGWNAGSATGSTHVVGASMRARYASIAGNTFNPAAALTVQGDLYHLAGGTIAIDLGGTSAGVDYDVIDVAGEVTLEGDLVVSLVSAGNEAFIPQANDSFQILGATQGISGQFASLDLPQLPWNLDWQLEYSSNAVTLSALTTGDFNKDGLVDAADLVVWKKHGGMQTEYAIWKSHFGEGIAKVIVTDAEPTSASGAPEPPSAILCLLIAGIVHLGQRRCPARSRGRITPLESR
jgi:hypothetical protein